MENFFFQIISLTDNILPSLGLDLNVTLNVAIVDFIADPLDKSIEKSIANKMHNNYRRNGSKKTIASNFRPIRLGRNRKIG